MSRLGQRIVSAVIVAIVLYFVHRLLRTGHL